DRDLEREVRQAPERAALRADADLDDGTAAGRRGRRGGVDRTGGRHAQELQRRADRAGDLLDRVRHVDVAEERLHRGGDGGGEERVPQRGRRFVLLGFVDRRGSGGE